MIPAVSWQDGRALEQVLEALRTAGCAVVEDAIPPVLLDAVAEGLDRGLEHVHETIGSERLRQSGEIGVVRAPMLASPVFYELLALPAVLALVDATVSPTAILHVQNGFVLPPAQPDHQGTFQRNFHRDFPRVLNGYVCSVNTLLAIDEFTANNGSTLVVPGTHQQATAPDEAFLRANAVPAECARGGMIVFDSTLWHAAGENATPHARRAVNQQFTRSYFKQQLDYVRCIGEEAVTRQQPRVRQLLGWDTRVPASLQDYYRPERMYLPGQG
jgi:ectoine hydroxylase-related dioxygenase (phytanoyl-CoA dioxygenase family)